MELTIIFCVNDVIYNQELIIRYDIQVYRKNLKLYYSSLKAGYITFNISLRYLCIGLIV